MALPLNNRTQCLYASFAPFYTSISDQANEHSLETIKNQAVDETKIHDELTIRGARKEEIERLIEVVKQIVSNPKSFNDQGMVYLRKNAKLPFTLQVHQDNTVYIHFKGKYPKKDLISDKKACQKKVYQAITQAGEVVAASVINEKNPSDNEKTFQLEKIALILFKNCKYLIQGHHVAIYPSKKQVSKYSIITELCNGKADRQFFDQLNLKQRWTFFLNILEGIQEMHRNGYCHNDIKGANILYKKINDNWEPRIIDFGMMLPKDKKTRSQCGSFPPPEVLALKENASFRVTEKLDVWKLGCYAARELFHINLETVYDEMDTNKNTPLPAMDMKKEENQKFYPIIKAMLERNPENRIPLDSAINQVQHQIHSIGKNAEIEQPNQIQLS